MAISSITLGKTQLICSGLRETELWAFLPVDRALSYSPGRQHYCSWSNSFSGNMVLKRLFLSDIEEDLAHFELFSDHHWVFFNIFQEH